ncbi:MAG TPA: class F sortase [Kineosporiaceae bacterium]|nr:class F sortase [Kineosporiaceae bacterium]
MLTRVRAAGGGTVVLALVGAYGVVLAVMGILAAVGFGGRGGPSPLGEAALARPVAPAPVLPTDTTTGTTTGSASGPASSAAATTSVVPSASVGRELPARPAVFTPTRVVLPDGSAAPVVPVGLHPDGALVIPEDVHTVGWWTGGSRAGEAYGSVVVAGHVDSATQGIGVFAALRRLAPGQVVELDGGGHALRYRIVSATEVPQAEISSRAGIFAVDGEPRLVLVTCGGAFDRERHRYQDNLVVVATPLT